MDNINLFLQSLLASEILKDELPNILYTPTSDNYTEVLQNYIRNERFNTENTPKPDVILAPRQETHVPEIVSLAKQAGTQLKIRSGGHDFEGLSFTNLTPFAILDMFRLNSVEINLDDESAWVQAGAIVGEVYYSIWEKSNVHAFPAGICPTVAVGGHVSGGGYGNLVRKYGLASDNVLDARIVDARGRVLDRKLMGEGLFWAIRGGGASSFCVVLAYKIRLVRVPPVVTVFNVSRTLEAHETELVDQWQAICDTVDNNLYLRLLLMPAGSKMVASIVAMFLGKTEDLMSLMKQNMPELGLATSDCKEMSWIRSTLFWSYFPDGTPETALLNRASTVAIGAATKSDFVKTPLSKADIAKLMAKMIELKDVTLELNPFGGRMNEISETETAYPHRSGNAYMILYMSYWFGKMGHEGVQRRLDIVRSLHDFMTQYVSENPRQAFLNYRDLDLGSSSNAPGACEEARGSFGGAYYNGNFQKLMEVKTVIDKDNFFRNEQSIPPLV